MAVFLTVWLPASLWMGCHTATSKTAGASQSETVRNEGCSLLYDLLSKQKDVNKLLLVKKETPEVKDLIEEIARTAKDAEEQLRQFAADDKTLDLKTPGLPQVEAKTRASIESARTKQLLFSSGPQFELRLLLSQAEGLSYGAHLAKVLHQQERDIRRKMFLEELSRQLERLYERTFDLLSARTRTRPG